jgi:hypothetical protein
LVAEPHYFVRIGPTPGAIAALGRPSGRGLRVTTSSRRIRIEVSDAGEGFEMPRPVPHPRGAGGYGLFLVNRMSACWGVERDQEAVVWCELERGVARIV